MEYLLRVKIVQRIEQVEEGRQELARRHAAGRRRPRRQRDPIDELPRVIRKVPRLRVAKVVGSDELGVMESGKGLELPLEVLLAGRIEALHTKEIVGNDTLGGFITGEVNGAHAVRAELPLHEEAARNDK